MATTASRLTDENIDKLCKLIRTGATLRAACDTVGFGWNNLRRWLALGGSSRFTNHRSYIEPEKAEPMYRDFAVKVDAAESHQKLILSRVIFSGAKNDPNLAFRVARNRWPREWQPELYKDDEGSDPVDYKPHVSLYIPVNGRETPEGLGDNVVFPEEDPSDSD